MLVAFLAYLKEDEVPEAITADDLVAFRIADQAQTKVETVLTLAAQHVDAFRLSADDGEAVYPDESSTGVPLTCVNFDVPDGHWLAADQDSVLSVAVATTNASAPWSEEEPHIYAGLYIADPHAATAQADREWTAAAAAHNLTALAYEPGLWLVDTRLLSDFTAVGASLETQAAALGQWLAETLVASAEVGPPQGDAQSDTGPTRQRGPRRAT